MSAFTAKVVQVGTEKVQTSSEKYVVENSQSFKQKHRWLGKKTQGTVSDIVGLCIISAQSKSSSLGFCRHTKNWKFTVVL